jgi:hypothetical protein
MAGLGPAIHAFFALLVKKQVVDGPNKSGHDGGERQAIVIVSYYMLQGVA